MSTTTTVTTEAITAENILRLFPDIDTTTSTDNSLEGYDEEQIRLMDEVCIVLDENDYPIGNASKKVCTLPLCALTPPLQSKNTNCQEQAI